MLRTFLPEEMLLERYNPSWLDMATVEGPDGPIMGWCVAALQRQELRLLSASAV